MQPGGIMREELRWLRGRLVDGIGAALANGTQFYVGILLFGLVMWLSMVGRR